MRLAHAALVLPVAVVAVTNVTGCGRKHASATPLAHKTQPVYSVAEVKKAFAAEGLPLTVVWRGRRITDLSPRAWNLVGDFQVSVWPPIKKSGTILVLIQAGHRTVRAGNVDVDYAPTSSMAASIRSAIARLRRTKSR